MQTRVPCSAQSVIGVATRNSVGLTSDRDINTSGKHCRNSFPRLMWVFLFTYNTAKSFIHERYSLQDYQLQLFIENISIYSLLLSTLHSEITPSSNIYSKKLYLLFSFYETETTTRISKFYTGHSFHTLGYSTIQINIGRSKLSFFHQKYYSGCWSIFLRRNTKSVNLRSNLNFMKTHHITVCNSWVYPFLFTIGGRLDTIHTCTHEASIDKSTTK